MRVGRARVVVDGRLHLLQHVVDLLKVFLGAEIGHGRQVVVLGERAVRTVADTKSVRRLRHVLGGQTTAGMHAERRVDGHQRAANLGIRTRVNLGALDASEKLVQALGVALARSLAKAGGGLVADVVGARAAHRVRVVHRGVVRRLRGLLLLAVVASLAVLVRVAKVALVGAAHVAIVVVEAGGRWKQVSLEILQSMGAAQVKEKYVRLVPG